MPRRRPDPDDADEDDFADDEDDLPDGVYHDDEPETTPCPHCGADLYEDAVFCARCENYVSKEDAPAERKPMWIWVLLILVTALMILGVVGGW